MTPILFYGVPSGCSFGSIVALEWLGQPYRLGRIEMPSVVTSDAYRRINPVAETPSLLTADGAVISETVAILHHLGARGTDRRLAFPQGTHDFDRWNQMLGFLNTSFFGSFAPLWYAVEHELEPQAKQALTEYGRAKVRKAHAQLEAMLGDRPWLLGEHRTLVDAYFVGIARWTRYHDVVDRRDYPALQRLFEKLEADPAVQFAHAIEEQRSAVSAGGFEGEVRLEEALASLRRPAA
ncbi:glutathione S-transferase family protein [Vulgatibacter sp.]|uniref:glutathione S-transferase family protein n=1 Tax=Vulgatibacter sp. TaxID=1971226 RepID=UPI0035628A69